MAGTEEEDAIEEETRFQNLSHVFGHMNQGIELESGLVIWPSGLRSAAFEIQDPEGEPLDVVDVDRFRSVREPDRCLQRYEKDEPDSDVGVA